MYIFSCISWERRWDLRDADTMVVRALSIGFTGSAKIIMAQEKRALGFNWLLKVFIFPMPAAIEAFAGTKEATRIFMCPMGKIVRRDSTCCGCRIFSWGCWDLLEYKLMWVIKRRGSILMYDLETENCACLSIFLRAKSFLEVGSL